MGRAMRGSRALLRLQLPLECVSAPRASAHQLPRGQAVRRLRRRLLLWLTRLRAPADCRRPSARH
ncbi:hypothetical protein PF008_g25811 [Phytophthora fragariae]|uniref:Uncharacterized protein n=1 Tax=Phytophthora fragariae TaxID=53985 RepID=A0A6G0QIW4_9STRA|nr:hypothetical protein PF008_g25811 [Phytophthora fragariae]